MMTYTPKLVDMENAESYYVEPHMDRALSKFTPDSAGLKSPPGPDSVDRPPYFLPLT